MTLSDVAIERPVFITMVSVAIVVLGLLGLRTLGVNLFPDVSFPVVTITTVYPGASPDEVEREVTERIEDAIASVAGVDRIQSASSESVSNVIILFELDVDPMEAATQVRERVAQVRASLPRDVEDPTVMRMDIGAAPIQLYTLQGGQSAQALRRFAEDRLEPALEQVTGVASIRVLGGRERQVNVDVDLDRALALGLTPATVAELVRRENVTIPGGGFDEGERRIAVRTVGAFASVEEIRQLPLRTAADGSIVRLADVAEVTDGFAEATEIVRSNGEPAVVFEVMKTSDANTVEVARGVTARLAELELPEGVTANILIDQAEWVLENVHEVQIALVFGGLMAVLVILVFLLDLRSTFITSLALPTSVLGAFFLMWMLGFTLNMMTLLGLSLAIGLLIDDSIVVRENIMKYLERGFSPKEAAKRGTREITLAVLATTAAICAVFVPVAFTGGMVGQFFREFGLTIAGATVISTWVAFTLDPMLSARMARSGPAKPGWTDRLKAPFLAFYRLNDGLYAALLGWILSRRWAMAAVLIGGVGMLMGSCALIPLMGSEFAAPEDRGMFNVDIELPAGTRLEEAARLSLPAELELQADPRFVTVYAQVGVQQRANRITYRVVAVPKTERDVNQLQLRAITREVVLRHMPEAKISITDPSIIEGARDYPIQIDILGEDYATLEPVARRLHELMATIPGTTDVDLQYSPGSPELEVRVDRDRAAQLGVPLAAVAGTVRASIEGQIAGTYRDGDEELDIRVRLREQDRSDVQRITDLRVASPAGLVPISDLATLERSDSPAEIQRANRRRVIMLTASPGSRALGDVVAEFQRRVEAEDLPHGISWTLEGQAKMMNESNESLGVALVLAILFIYLVLASQFESFLHPVTIMMALPLAIVGAIVALFLQGSTFSMGATIGIILLMGLVTKNGILLIDHAAVRVRVDGWDPKRAILHAGPARLRPILMTSAAMVLGMLPTALNQGPGSEFRSPMAMGVIGGVISSTILTLLVVPVVYLAMEALRRGFARWVLGRATPWPQPTPDPFALEDDEPPAAGLDAEAAPAEE
ncbi:MAG: efflux RND transporter permease subunit [Sandaracinaceae bacterium]|nr:efflux RND transporter permease subunit [Sandaracinaceae bacterium]